jgi:hypothetical protein
MTTKRIRNALNANGAVEILDDGTVQFSDKTDKTKVIAIPGITANTTMVTRNLISSFNDTAAAGSGIANGASYTYTGYIVGDATLVRISVIPFVGLNAVGAMADFLVGRYGTGSTVTNILASNFAVTVNGSYQIVLTNNTGSTVYPHITMTRIN